jgi:hypothetical protein
VQRGVQATQVLTHLHRSLENLQLRTVNPRMCVATLKQVTTATILCKNTLEEAGLIIARDTGVFPNRPHGSPTTGIPDQTASPPALPCVLYLTTARDSTATCKGRMAGQQPGYKELGPTLEPGAKCTRLAGGGVPGRAHRTHFRPPGLTQKRSIHVRAQAPKLPFTCGSALRANCLTRSTAPRGPKEDQRTLYYHVNLHVGSKVGCSTKGTYIQAQTM